MRIGTPHGEVLSKSDIVFREIDGLQLMREIVFAYQQSSPMIEKLKTLVINHRQ